LPTGVFVQLYTRKIFSIDCKNENQKGFTR